MVSKILRSRWTWVGGLGALMVVAWSVLPTAWALQKDRREPAAKKREREEPSRLERVAANDREYFRMPIRTMHDPTRQGIWIDRDGMLRGKVLVGDRDGREPSRLVVGETILLLQGEKVIDQARVQVDGSFELKTSEPGRYELAGNYKEYLAAFKTGPVVAEPAGIRGINDEKREPEPKDMRSPKGTVDPPTKLPPEDEILIDPEDRIGTQPNRTERVILGVDGVFRITRPQRVHHASNDEVFLDAKGTFRGIITTLGRDMVRRPLTDATVFLSQDGKLLRRTLTGNNGSFWFETVPPGAYTIAATVRLPVSAEEIRNRAKLESETSLSKKEESPLRAVQDVQSDPPSTPPSDPNLADPPAEFRYEVAIQKIAVRPQQQALRTVGPTAEFSRNDSGIVIRVQFMEPSSELPVLHLSPGYLFQELQTAVPTGVPAIGIPPLGNGAAAGAGAGAFGGLLGAPGFPIPSGAGGTPTPQATVFSL